MIVGAEILTVDYEHETLLTDLIQTSSCHWQLTTSRKWYTEELFEALHEKRWRLADELIKL